MTAPPRRRQADYSWYVEKKISLPSLVLLVGQIVALVIAGTTFYNQQGSNTRDIARNAAAIERLAPLPTQLQVLQATIGEMRCDLNPERCQYYRGGIDALPPRG